MKRPTLGAVYEWGLPAVLFLIVLHAPIIVGLGQVFNEYEQVLKAWKEIALTGLAGMAVVLVTRQKMWKRILAKWPIRLSLLFIGLHLLLVAIFDRSVYSEIGGLMIDLRFVAMFMLMYILICIRPTALSRVVKTVAAAAAVAIGFGLLQITVLPDNILSGIGYSKDSITPFTTIDRNPDYVRINSTLRGPNPLGALMMIYTALAAAYLLKRGITVDKKKRIIVATGAIGAAAVLYASYSRSAYVALVAALLILFVTLRRFSKRVALVSIGVMVTLAVGVTFVYSTDWFSNVILHEDPESTVVSKSNDEHVESLINGAERVVAQPFGAGIGSTGSASLYDDDTSNDFIIENNYFFIAHESGWAGIVLFMGLYAAVLIGLWRRRANWIAVGLFASGIGLGIIGILLPVWVDETVAMTWWGLSGAMLAISGIMKDTNGTRTRKQKTTRAT